MNNVILINGHNLNLLGKRENEIYVNLSLEEIKEMSITKSEELNIKLKFVQSNSESEIIDLIL